MELIKPTDRVHWKYNQIVFFAKRLKFLLYIML